MLAWFNALLAPLITIHGWFQSFRAKNLYRLSHGTQVAFMEAVLNDRFDNTSRRISLVDGLDTSPTIIYRRDELKPFYIKRRSESSPEHLFRRSETGANFIVRVPIGLVYDVYEMRALIDSYRLVSINQYKIEEV